MSKKKGILSAAIAFVLLVIIIIAVVSCSSMVRPTMVKKVVKKDTWTGSYSIKTTSTNSYDYVDYTGYIYEDGSVEIYGVQNCDFECNDVTLHFDWPSNEPWWDDGIYTVKSNRMQLQNKKNGSFYGGSALTVYVPSSLKKGHTFIHLVLVPRIKVDKTTHVRLAGHDFYISPKELKNSGK